MVRELAVASPAGGSDVARFVKLAFGGKIAATWDTLPNIIAAYRDLAATYSLTMKQYGFTHIYVEGSGELSGVEFWFLKDALPEAQLAAFNETWFDLAVAGGFERMPTTINYYEE